MNQPASGGELILQQTNDICTWMPCQSGEITEVFQPDMENKALNKTLISTICQN